MTLLEPMALLLNWVLCAQALIYYSRLGKDETDKFEKCWRGFFLFFAVSTFFGGPSHLFFGYLGMLGKIPGWIAGAIAISYIELAVASEAKSKNKWITTVISIKFIATLLLLFVDLNFKWVMVHTAIGLIAILGVSSTISVVNGKTPFKYFLLAILAMVMALPFRVLDINFHLWFNRDDIGHVFMCMTLYLFYKGIDEKRIAQLIAKPIQ